MVFFKKRDPKREIADIKDAMEKSEEMPTYLDDAEKTSQRMTPPRAMQDRNIAAPRSMTPMPSPMAEPMEMREPEHVMSRHGLPPSHPLNPQPRHFQPEQGPPVSAPLFVKVEKYREILVTVQEMKLFISGMKQLFNILHELEAVRTDSINIMRATVQRLDKSMMEIDQELLRPKGINLGDLSSGSEISHIEDTMASLQKQLTDLRKELQGMQ